MSRYVVPFVALHLLISTAAAAVFVLNFGHDPHSIVTHVVVVGSWDLMLVSLLGMLLAWTSRPRFSLLIFRVLLAITCALQAYLYTLNIVSNMAWGRNVTGRVVAAFAPTIWSGKEPFPIGAMGISIFVCGVLVLMMGLLAWWAQRFDTRFEVRGVDRPGRRRTLSLAIAAATVAICYATIAWGTAARDNLFWRQELVASFLRPVGYAFEPTARRHAVAERDALLRASYPRRVPGAQRKHVVLIIVDSLRADRMQVYGYQRPTTPFLAQLVRSGRMKRVEAAFSTCSESFCGITSTLAGREFRDISARTFQLQDVLSDEGYQTWFLLSGNHGAWNGLPQFYRASDGTFFDGSHTQRYTTDDDRLVLEGLERVPMASADRPAFFYIHLMSPHYLGVQFPDSHVFTRPDDRASPGLEPYKILQQLNKPDRYDDKVLQVDGIIRQLFEVFAMKGYLNDAMVVVTADHGEGLGERHWAHGWNLYEEDIRIPLLFYDSPPARYPDLTFAAMVDIAPTILDRLGLPIPSSWDGQSLLAPTRTRFTYHQTYFFPNRFAVLYRNSEALFKFIATPQYNIEELYDLRRDRGEVRNLVTEQPALAALLREKVLAYRSEM